MRDGVASLLDINGSPVALSSCSDWTVSKSGKGQTGVAAVVNKIESIGSRALIRLHVIAGAFLDIEVPGHDIESLHLASNESVILMPRESRTSSTTAAEPARVPSIAERESDCTQCFPTGP